MPFNHRRTYKAELSEGSDQEKASYILTTKQKVVKLIGQWVALYGLLLKEDPIAVDFLEVRLQYCALLWKIRFLLLRRRKSIIVLRVAATEAEEGGGSWFPSEQRAEGTIPREEENKNVNRLCNLTTSAASTKCLEPWIHFISCFYIPTDWRMDTSRWAGWASSDSWLQNVDIRVSSAVMFLMSLSHCDVCRQNQQFDWFSNCEEPVGRLQPIRAHDKGEQGTKTNT